MGEHKQANHPRFNKEAYFQKMKCGNKINYSMGYAFIEVLVTSVIVSISIVAISLLHTSNLRAANTVKIQNDAWQLSQQINQTLHRIQKPSSTETQDNQKWQLLINSKQHSGDVDNISQATINHWQQRIASLPEGMVDINCEHEGCAVNISFLRPIVQSHISNNHCQESLSNTQQRQCLSTKIVF